MRAEFRRMRRTVGLALLGLGGSVDSSGPVNKEDALTRGPQAVELKGIPLTPDAIAAVAALRVRARRHA